VRNCGYRTVNRFTQYDIEFTGDPVVWTSHREGARPVLVESVRLDFAHGDEGYSVSATIQGPYLSSSGKPLKAQASDHAGPVDFWPAWLRALADEHKPEAYAEHRGPLSLDTRPHGGEPS
jgi:hypothetical protein